MTKIFLILQTLLCCLVLLFCAWKMHWAANALERASEDFRDTWQAFYAQEVRANYELGQISKDRIRIRELLKKMEKKNGIHSPTDQPEQGGAPGDPPRSNHKTPGASKKSASP